MDITFTLHQTRTDFTENGEAFYRVENEIVATTNITAQVFLIEKGDTEADDAFARVCTPADIAQYATDRGGSDKFYRTNITYKTFPTVKKALGYADHVKGRLDLLKTEYADVVNDFRVENEETVI